MNINKTKFKNQSTTSIPENWTETTLGFIPNDWKIISAEQFCDKVADGTHDSPKKAEEGRLLITSKNIKDGKLDISSAYRISLQDFDKVNKRSKVDKWDILLSMIGTVGEVCLISQEPDFAIKNVGLFKCGNKSKAKWLYYFLRSSMGTNYLLSRLSGTTQKYITLGELRSFPIIIPTNSAEQQAIAQVLSSFDDKIELLREENKTLEELGQTIFKEWFGKYSINDELPEGWRVGKLGEKNFAEIIGSGIKKFEGEKIYIATADASDSGISNTNIKITFQERPSRANMQPKEKSIWFAKMQDSRKLMMFDDFSKYEIENFILSTGFAGIKTTELSHYFMWCFILSKKFDELKNKMAGGAVQIAINNRNLEKIEFVVPENGVLEKFNKTTRSVFEKIYNNDLQIKSLSCTRDELLPKLMSGEMRVNF